MSKELHEELQDTRITALEEQVSILKESLSVTKKLFDKVTEVLELQQEANKLVFTALKNKQ